MSELHVDVVELTATIASLVSQTDRLQAEIRMRPLKWTTQIYDLGDEEYALLEPLPILVEEYPEDANIVARLPELELIGEGATTSEAIWALKQATLDLYDEITSEDPILLGGLPQSWLRILNRTITKRYHAKSAWRLQNLEYWLHQEHSR